MNRSELEYWCKTTLSLSVDYGRYEDVPGDAAIDSMVDTLMGESGLNDGDCPSGDVEPYREAGLVRRTLAESKDIFGL